MSATGEIGANPEPERVLVRIRRISAWMVGEGENGGSDRVYRARIASILPANFIIRNRASAGFPRQNHVCSSRVESGLNISWRRWSDELIGAIAVLVFVKHGPAVADSVIFVAVRNAGVPRVR